MKGNYLNLGCGRVFHKEWINVDMVPKDPEVIPMDISKKLKFDDSSMDMVYHSHVLEHIPKQFAKGFLMECYRVLKPGGIIRVAVPDLEVIASNYLNFLNQNLQKETAESLENYNWAMIEMYDQTVRTQSGGELIPFLKRDDLPNKEFLKSRSSDAVKIIEGRNPKQNLAYMIKLFKPLRFKVKLYVLRQYVTDFILSRLFPGGKYFKLGSFRMSGEIHQWMYDQYSLARLLKECGFKEPEKVTAFKSRNQHWQEFNLDAVNGKIYKPDSLFMEAIK